MALAKSNQTLPKLVIADPGLASWIRNANPEYPNGFFTFLYRPPEFLCRLNTDQSFYPTLKGDIFAIGEIIRELLIVWLQDDQSLPPWLDWISEEPPAIDEIKTAQNFFRRLFQ